MKAVVDRAMCVGHAQCSAICPAVFASDELGFAVVVGDGDVAPEHRDAAREAVESCPEQAIAIIE
jgi:ferredoxin